jgi:hypothetical protein
MRIDYKNKEIENILNREVHWIIRWGSLIFLIAIAAIFLILYINDNTFIIEIIKSIWKVAK